MKTTIHRADTRGFANHGWLQSSHTFSFAGYYNPERIHFGALRVLNDDTVKGGMGFGAHPHDNMEIVSIPLSGALEHRDTTGRHKIINQHDVQIMSAGSGIEHSEFNASKTEPVKFLQIWLFPKHRDVAPRYDQQTFEPADRHNRLQVVVSPEGTGEGLPMNQDAWFSLEISIKGNPSAIPLKGRQRPVPLRNRRYHHRRRRNPRPAGCHCSGRLRPTGCYNIRRCATAADGRTHARINHIHNINRARWKNPPGFSFPNVKSS